jgi:hypothetical protein
MGDVSATGAAAWRRWSAAALAAASVGLGGCASMYVDGNLPETLKTEFRKPAQPPAVQLAFEFQTKGTANARATDYLKPKVQAQVQDSGLFSSISDKPAAGAGLLVITLNNIPLTDNAAAKGFLTGLTFGLAGSTVADGYDATLRYTPAASGSAVIAQEAKHVIHTSLGTGSPPPGAIKTSGGEEAVTLMTRQVLSRLLGNLSKDPAFPAGKPAAPTNAAEAAKLP